MEVAEVVAVKCEATVSPTTESAAYGEEVPMPRRELVVLMRTKSADVTVLALSKYATYPVVPGPTVPAPEPLTHVPFIEKHPFVRLMPFANVEEAVVDVTFNRFVCSPPVSVEVPVPENAYVPVAYTFPNNASPCTLNSTPGVVVLIPTSPVDLLITKSFVLIEKSPLAVKFVVAPLNSTSTSLIVVFPDAESVPFTLSVEPELINNVGPVKLSVSSLRKN